MASMHIIALVLLVVGATIPVAYPQKQPEIPVAYAIPNVTDPEIQDMGRFAVEQYNKKGESHLIFKEVFGGHIFYWPRGPGGIYYFVDLMAINCSHSGALGNYTGQVYKVGWSAQTYRFIYLRPLET